VPEVFDAICLQKSADGENRDTRTATPQLIPSGIQNVWLVVTECNEQARQWLICTGGRIEVWGWKKYKKRVLGDPRLVRETIRTITLKDLQ